jgi:hypothetical protein
MSLSAYPVGQHSLRQPAEPAACSAGTGYTSRGDRTRPCVLIGSEAQLVQGNALGHCAVRERMQTNHVEPNLDAGVERLELKIDRNLVNRVHEEDHLLKHGHQQILVATSVQPEAPGAGNSS